MILLLKLNKKMNKMKISARFQTDDQYKQSRHVGILLVYIHGYRWNIIHTSNYFFTSTILFKNRKKVGNLFLKIGMYQLFIVLIIINNAAWSKLSTAMSNEEKKAKCQYSSWETLTTKFTQVASSCAQGTRTNAAKWSLPVVYLHTTI